MACDINEKYLLKFISCASDNSLKKENELLDVLYDFGIKLKFKNTNPVYQIIDELYFSKYI